MNLAEAMNQNQIWENSVTYSIENVKNELRMKNYV